MKKFNKILFVLGILICLVGAGLMLDGTILGETTANTATIIEIIGIGLIANQKRTINNGGE